MTLKEKINVCRICKNRSFNAKEGLICGNTGAKPAFEDECHDFDLDITEQERLKKLAAEAAEIDRRQSGAFRFYIGFFGAGLLSFLWSYLSYTQTFSLEDLFSFSFLFMFFYVYFNVYAIYAYIKKKSDAIFIAKYFSVILFIGGLYSLFTGTENLMNIIFELGIPVGLYLFLTYSKEINKTIPKEDRKLTMLNKIMVILSIIVQLFFYIGDFVGTESHAVTVMDSDEKKLKEMCQELKKTLPRDISEDCSWSDVTLNDSAVEFIYVYNDGMTPEFGEFAELQNKYRTEIAKEYVLALRNQEPLIDLLAETNKYGMRFKYFSPEGKLILDITVSNSEIKRLISQGEYSTRRSDFLSILESFNKLIPSIEFFNGCKLCKCTLSDDGKTLHIDLKLYGDTVETLAELTPKYMREQILHFVLPGMLGDIPVELAIRNKMNISFDHTSEDISSWRLNVLIESHEYNQIFNQ